MVFADSLCGRASAMPATCAWAIARVATSRLESALISTAIWMKQASQSSYCATRSAPHRNRAESPSLGNAGADSRTKTLESQRTNPTNEGAFCEGGTRCGSCPRERPARPSHDQGGLVGVSLSVGPKKRSRQRPPKSEILNILKSHDTRKNKNLPAKLKFGQALHKQLRECVGGFSRNVDQERQRSAWNGPCW